VISEATRSRIEELFARYPTRRSAMVPLLLLLQEERGWLSPETMREAAEILDLPTVRIYEVVTFYTMLRTRPCGKYLLQVCRNLSCSLVGGEGILRRIEERLGIHDGQTTPDGKFTLMTVECLGSCGTGPVVQVNDDYHESLTVEKLDLLLDSLA
jgi:NADH-quinone oxidoreductase E subunit